MIVKDPFIQREIMQNKIKELQSRAASFLQSYCLRVNGVTISLKEIEVYYYEKGVFEDYTVHCNKLQMNNKFHFYVHRTGKSKDYKPKGGTRCGCDFVLSDKDNVYYTFLIRGIVIDRELIVGPNNSLKAILSYTSLSYSELEGAKVELVPCKNDCHILPSPRIGLGKPEEEKNVIFHDAELRMIVCDEYFKQTDKRSKCGYKLRTDAIDNFLRRQLGSNNMTKEEAIKYSQEMYGAVSRWLKDL